MKLLIEKLTEIGIENPTLEARWIIEEYPTIDSQKIEDIVSRRASGEPLSRIFGWREFYGRRFDVNEFTLDPRPDSETLVDAVLSFIGNKQTILDVGAGTGCLLITLLCELNEAQGTAVDISSDALLMTQKNATHHNVQDRIKCIESNWFETVSGVFDVIISNPPYIRSHVIPELDESVRNFDPILALDGGLSGIEPYKILLEGGKKLLAQGGRLFFEIGFDQTNQLVRLIENYGATLIHVYRDLGGHDRVLEIAYGDK